MTSIRVQTVDPASPGERDISADACRDMEDSTVMVSKGEIGFMWN